ncbi:MAG TPA: cytochrome c [Terriglobia bacterium]|nr:cytochrome c [Terriglobia bacterium]
MVKTAIIRSILMVGVACSALLASAQKEGASLPDGPGKEILTTACAFCHKLTEVTKFSGFYSRENWRDIVNTMVLDGAAVSQRQVPVLVDYLTRTFPRQFPDGPEKDMLDSACSTCHPVTDIRKMDGFLTRDDWQDVIRVMAAKGAKIDEDRIPALADYLSTTFPRLRRPTASASQ